MNSDFYSKPTVTELFALLLNASVKAYEASWLKEGKEVYRDASGQFASKDGVPPIALTTPDETERERASKELQKTASGGAAHPIVGVASIRTAVISSIPMQGWSLETQRAVTKDVEEGFALLDKQNQLNTQNGSNPRAYFLDAETLIDKLAKKASPGALMFAKMALADTCLTPEESHGRKNKLIENARDKVLKDLGELEKISRRTLPLGETLRKGIKDAVEAVKKGLERLKVEADKKLKELGLDGPAKAIGDFAKSQAGNIAFVAQSALVALRLNRHISFAEHIIASHVVHKIYRGVEEGKVEEAEKEFREVAEKNEIADPDELLSSLDELKHQTNPGASKMTQNLATQKMLALHKQLHSRRQAENIAAEFKKANTGFIANVEGESATGEVNSDPDELIERATAKAEIQAEEEIKEIVSQVSGTHTVMH
jgi:hypothetical protein